VEDLSLYFLFPGFENIELKPNGKNTDVTIHNLQEYIDLVMNFMFHETVKVQISAFKKGFNSIFSIDSLKSFSTSDELEEMICGTNKNDEEWTNVQILSENIVPAHGYH
jgi:E3 ubiquitin-protein ligase TRIP12